MLLNFNLIDAWRNMAAQLPELPIQDIGLKYVYPIFLALIVVEYVRARHLFDLKESLSGFVIAIGATVMRLLTQVLEVSLYLFLFAWAAPFREEFLGFTTLGFAWYVWLLAILADDHNFYWHHRLSHNIRLLWAAHLPHHSARTFNLTVSIRNGWFITLYKPIFWIWMPLVGFEPIMIATCLIANSMYQFFLHSQLVPSLGWYEKLFNTPYIHTVHHSSNTEYLDRNHGGILVIWDKLYGTWQKPIAGVKPKYGISHDPDTYDPIKHNLFEFQEIWRDMKKSPKLRHKFMYMFGPPGWSHDGSSKTSRQLQAELKQAPAQADVEPVAARA
ncbi:MAG: sterol desaturase family protein [Flavobacteriales bacterium]|jgi:sterol desaturase/sphingolipid hydroxylase (fatty acid hydroxylase superfamily)|nr:sterol desaturase family protein [Flavobacteriales bacterium]